MRVGYSPQYIYYELLVVDRIQPVKKGYIPGCIFSTKFKLYGLNLLTDVFLCRVLVVLIVLKCMNLFYLCFSLGDHMTYHYPVLPNM